MKGTVNGELFITLPEGFRCMTPDELKRMYTTDVETVCGFWHQERHVIVMIAWNVSNKILAKIASPKDIAKRVEKTQARALKAAGYHKGGFFDATIAGAGAHGVRFGYTAQGVDQSAEAVVFMHDATCYTLYYFARSENAQRDADLHDDILASLSFQ